MSVSTICEVCEAAIAVQTCRRCGANVCRDHYVESVDACQLCATVLSGP